MDSNFQVIALALIFVDNNVFLSLKIYNFCRSKRAWKDLLKKNHESPHRKTKNLGVAKNSYVNFTIIDSTYWRGCYSFCLKLYLKLEHLWNFKKRLQHLIGSIGQFWLQHYQRALQLTATCVLMYSSTYSYHVKKP